MNGSKDMLRFATGVAIGAAIWQFLSSRDGRELTAKLSTYLKNRYSDATTTGDATISTTIKPNKTEEDEKVGE